jgi:hypothetical protein
LLAGQTSFTKEVSSSQDGDHCFFATRLDNRDLNIALLDVEEGIRGVPLRENSFIGR